MEDTASLYVLEEITEYQPHFVHATRGQRMANYLVDMLFYFFCCFVILYYTGIMILPQAGGAWDMNIMFPDTSLIYTILLPAQPLIFTLMEGATGGRSLGKLLTGTVAVKKDINAITWKDAFIRSLLRIIPLDPLSGFTAHPLHDKFSNTYVVKKEQIIW